ncbi:hypothetical protein GLP25_08350 [Photobacterium phosphoreum]|uniref:hypothetical protein n=1 Tax=Photobacterium phosphoreum TaxID=659 RepID=UPI001E585F00|nr:hypothetical protein [Photobacterium phosphoreum]MCD9483200.1 hypothetical protein [Photobacterium phosphoreum]
MTNSPYKYHIRKCVSGFQVVLTCKKTGKKYYVAAATTYKEALEYADCFVITKLLN